MGSLVKMETEKEHLEIAVHDALGMDVGKTSHELQTGVRNRVRGDLMV